MVDETIETVKEKNIMAIWEIESFEGKKYTAVACRCVDALKEFDKKIKGQEVVSIIRKYDNDPINTIDLVQYNHITQF